jgi:ligand-binding SRPBCC domain-containing protein
MLHFQKSSLVDASIKTVWEFYEQSDILQILTPPWQPVEIVRREGGLEVGALSEFRLWLGLLPIQWIAVHTECVPYHYFTDEQKVGPLVSWRHRHQFASQGEKTRLTDAIDFELPGGWLTELILSGWVTSRLNDMFNYRHQITQKHCKG